MRWQLFALESILFRWIRDDFIKNTKTKAVILLSTINFKDEIKHLSKLKWDLMANRNTAELNEIFHDSSKLIHMGGTWGKNRDLEIIKSVAIHYKQADIHCVEVNVINDSAILLNEITLLAIVGGNEVTNRFNVIYKTHCKKLIIVVGDRMMACFYRCTTYLYAVRGQRK